MRRKKALPARKPPKRRKLNYTDFYVLDGHRAIVWRWSRRLREKLASGRVDSVTVNWWGRPTLAPLAAYRKSIRRLSLGDPRVRDLSAVSELTKLEYLYIGGLGPNNETWREDALEAIDFSRLERLEQIGLEVEVPRFGNLEECRALRSANITACGLRELTPLSGLGRLQKLEISEAPLRSLAGVEGLRALKWLRLRQVPLERLDGLRHAQRLGEIGLYYLRRLQSVAELAELPQLRVLGMYGSRKIGDLERLGEVLGLERLSFEGVGPLPTPTFLSRLKNLKELVLMQVGNLPSLGFLRDLRSLEMLGLDATTVRDGDMSVLLDLPALKHVHYRDRPHYSHSSAEIEAALATRKRRSTRKAG
jgi:hypothetical protein